MDLVEEEKPDMEEVKADEDDEIVEEQNLPDGEIDRWKLLRMTDAPPDLFLSDDIINLAE